MRETVRVSQTKVRRDYLERGLSVSAIARKYGYSINTLLRRMRKWGIPVVRERQFGGRIKTGSWPQLADKAWLAEQLKTKAAKQIASELGTTSGNVADFVKRHGLRIGKKSIAVRDGIQKRFPEGKPGRKFDAHHNWRGGRMKAGDYIKVRVEGHPEADNRGYVAEHRLIMEQHKGRYLKPDEVVHHKNGDKSDNRIENLELMPNQVEHMRLHRSVRSLREKIRARDEQIALLKQKIKKLKQ